MAISDSTYKNWKRLGTNAAGRLTSRANKSKSKKRFIPKERCTNPKTPAFICLVHSIFKAENADMASVMFSLCLEKLLVCGVARPLVDEFILKRCLPRVPALSGIPMPEEFDLLGTVYQSLLEEREKNRCGSYYTPQAIVGEMVEEIGAGSEKTFFDPCCGSGAASKEHAAAHFSK